MDKIDYKPELSKAMRFCSSKEVCKSDMVEKCRRWGVDDCKINKIINTLEEEDFLNEERYAYAFVKDKFRFNKWGKIKIESHLRFKKINTNIISNALDIIEENEYLDLIKQLIENKTIKANNPFEKKQKILRFLTQKGFETDYIYRALNDIRFVEET